MVRGQDEGADAVRSPPSDIWTQDHSPCRLPSSILLFFTRSTSRTCSSRRPASCHCRLSAGLALPPFNAGVASSAYRAGPSCPYPSPVAAQRGGRRVVPGAALWPARAGVTAPGPRSVAAHASAVRDVVAHPSYLATLLGPSSPCTVTIRFALIYYVLPRRAPRQPYPDHADGATIPATAEETDVCWLLRASVQRPTPKVARMREVASTGTGSNRATPSDYRPTRSSQVYQRGKLCLAFERFSVPNTVRSYAPLPHRRA